MSILFYKKPDYITKEGGPLTKSSCQKYAERAAYSRSQIPPELSFENVMRGKTLPPCSISDFLDYLVYISHDAENLQFWLWLRDYTARFESLPDAKRRLSPQFISGEDSQETLSPQPRSRLEEDDKAAVENERFARQPFRKEISLITTHYILPGAPRELNISHRDRSTLLAALSKTTHPSAFSQILDLTTLTLKNHSHPNFVRWSICNGNKPRILVMRSLAFFVLSSALIISLLLILSNKTRWLRIVVAFPVWFGTINIVAAARGLCVLLFRRATREEHPWEIGGPIMKKDRSSQRRSQKSDDSQQLVINLGARKDKYGQIPSPHIPPTTITTPTSPRSSSTTTTIKEQKPAVFDMDLEALSVLSGRTLNTRLEPFGPANTWTEESWVDGWKKMPWVRKLVLRKVWVKEEGLRILQNRILLQGHLWAIIVTTIYTVGIVACPEVGLY